MIPDEIKEAKRDGVKRADLRMRGKRRAKCTPSPFPDGPKEPRSKRQKAIEWFHARIGGARGKCMLSAAFDADAEIEALALGWRVDWEPENESPMDIFGDTPETREECERINAGLYSWEWACVRLPGDRKRFSGASLGGICIDETTNAGRDYRRIVEAELFAETLAMFPDRTLDAPNGAD